MINIIPAIDVMDGKCVRLTQGDYGRSRTYGGQPLDVARYFEDCGITFLHLVDLDGARSAGPANLRVLEIIASGTSLKVEFGGGVKDAQAVSSAFDAGASRVICGSMACRNPDLFISCLGTYGGNRIVLGADVRDGLVAVNGWQEKSEASVADLLERFLPGGLSTVIVTDISRDGMLDGPAVDLYSELMHGFPGVEIIASGGVASIGDIEALDKAGVPAVIVGKAIYEGRIDIRELAGVGGFIGL